MSDAAELESQFLRLDPEGAWVLEAKRDSSDRGVRTLASEGADLATRPAQQGQPRKRCAKPAWPGM